MNRKKLLGMSMFCFCFIFSALANVFEKQKSPIRHSLIEDQKERDISAIRKTLNDIENVLGFIYL